jgi:hypothetical protein
VIPMPELSCQSIKDSLLSYFSEATVIVPSGDGCGITFPLPTVDGRQIEVYIEFRAGNYAIVHDGGRAVNELILQGVKVTDSIHSYMDSLAKRYGATYTDESFRLTGLRSSIQEMIAAVGMCSALAMGQLIGNIAIPVEEPIREQFGHALRSWARKKMKVSVDVAVRGRRAQHKFDFVGYPKESGLAPIAMSVISPGSNPLAAAERFGFKATDLDSTRYQNWRRVAVQGRSELWSNEARTILRDCADEVIEVSSGEAIKTQRVGSVLAGLLRAS